MLTNALIMAAGYVILFLWQYIPLMMGGSLLIPEESLFSIVAIPYIVEMPLGALILTYFFRKTGHIYVGAFLVTIMLVALMVAGTATHFAF